jgi:tetratricopeptide (TPR) repeat protein
MPSFPKRYYFIAGGITAVLIGAITFRARISEMLTFGAEPPLPAALTTPPVSSGSDTLTPKAEDGKIKSPGVAGGVISQTPKFPPYKGRNPGEIRPVDEEIKLFTEDQRQQLYQTIQIHANAVAENPRYFNGWIQIGILKKTIGDFEGARDAWEYASVIEPLNSLSFANLGELYWRYLHEYEKSEENLRLSIKHKPDDIQTYLTLSELYHYSVPEKKDQAPDVLREGLGANPRQGTLMRRLAYLHEQRKEYDKALEWWEKILVLSPDDEKVKERIAALKDSR